MTTETITTIVFVVTVFLLFGNMLASGLKKARLAKISYALMALGWILLLVIDIFGTNSNRFTFGMDNVVSNQYHMPLIDSTMLLYRMDKDRRVYVTTSYKWNDSTAFHYQKEVSTNIFGIYKITDEFINRKVDKSLTWTFKTPSFFRDSSSVFYLQTLGDIRNSTNDTITKPEAIKILKNWQVFGKAFREYQGVY
jgi:hypothetical protein